MTSTPTTHNILITPRDPLIARDGRPFTAGNRMQSLDWFYPSVAAGSLRSLLGKQAGTDFSNPDVHDPLRQIRSRGPFPVINGKLYLPAPKDLAYDCKTNKVYASRPAALNLGEGTDLQDGSLSELLPALLDNDDDFKPASSPAFWSVEKLAEWLALPKGKRDWSFAGDDFLKAAERDTRFHVEINASSGAAAEGQLFTTVGLDLSGLEQFLPIKTNETQRAASVSQSTQLLVEGTASNGYASGLQTVKQLHPLGGERRLAYWESESGTSPRSAGLWSCPVAITTALQAESRKPLGQQLVRLMLASPGLFRTGWVPEWLAQDRTGIPPHTGGKKVRLQLVSACVDRWRPVSGWNLQTNQPKATQRVVPSGAVYFFNVLEGDVTALAESWLKPTYWDDSQPARDGFGLALWGVWG